MLLKGCPETITSKSNIEKIGNILKMIDREANGSADKLVDSMSSWYFEEDLKLDTPFLTDEHRGPMKQRQKEILKVCTKHEKKAFDD